ncbi:type IV pilus modification protein PilV [Propionivibrio soli]|uniref:type IV pilus modification protein PilV n=1 Tax=Propionivibrio soli TaxID=2976531 RepID=UPI003B84AA93
MSQKYAHNIMRLQSGSTMLEVLIAILVLSFGLLGMSGLIVNGLRTSSSSNYRSIAAQHLAEMVELAKADPTGFADFVAASSSTVTQNCLRSAGCTSAEIRATRYGMWLDNLGSVLPGGAGVICLDSSPEDGIPDAWACDASSGSPRSTVKICWNESHVSSAWSNACLSAQI